MFGKSTYKYRIWQIWRVMVLVAIMAFPAPAAEFIVDTTADTVDINPGDGIAADKNGSCSLRAAIMEANALVGPDIILLGPTTFQLTVTGEREDEGLTGDLDIFSALEIRGAGTYETIIDANGLDRVIHIRGSWNVRLSDLTIRNGRAPDGYWDETGGTFISGGSGGGICNRNGNLVLVRCCVTQNRTGDGKLISPGPGYAGNGGGIYCNGGTLDMEDSSISENSTGFGLGRYSYSGSMGKGGGIFLNDCRSELRNCLINDNRLDGREYPDVSTLVFGAGVYLNGGTATLINCTVSQNIGTGNYGEGGGMWIQATVVNLVHCTIVFNAIDTNGNGTGGGMALVSYDFGVTMKSTIVAENRFVDYFQEGTDIEGFFVSGGYNLVEDPRGWHNRQEAPGDIVGVSPRLAPLADNGGPTLTHALLSLSPAIDGADPEETLTSDQRGVPRPQDGNLDRVAVADIGAFELSFPSVEIQAPANGATLRGNVTVEAVATNCTQVVIHIDGKEVAVLTAEPYVFDWDTGTYANGAHQVTAIAADWIGQTATDSVAVFLDNIQIDLEVARRSESSWLVREREYAEVKISIPHLDTAAVDRVEVRRRLGEADFQIVRALGSEEFVNGFCRYCEPAPKTDETVTYRAVAVDSAGNVLGQSPVRNL